MLLIALQIWVCIQAELGIPVQRVAQGTRHQLARSNRIIVGIVA
jgi:hypothetical protein